MHHRITTFLFLNTWNQRFKQTSKMVTHEIMALWIPMWNYCLRTITVSLGAWYCWTVARGRGWGYAVWRCPTVRRVIRAQCCTPTGTDHSTSCLEVAGRPFPVGHEDYWTYRSCHRLLSMYALPRFPSCFRGWIASIFELFFYSRPKNICQYIM